MKYKLDYDQFMLEYQSGTTNAEAVGILIARMAQYFAEYNIKSVELERIFNKKAAEIETSSDVDTGKPISSAKAKVLAVATDEYGSFLETNAHLKNIEQYLSSLKYLQRGLLQEYSQAGLT